MHTVSSGLSNITVSLLRVAFSEIFFDNNLTLLYLLLVVLDTVQLGELFLVKLNLLYKSETSLFIFSYCLFNYMFSLHY